MTNGQVDPVGEAPHPAPVPKALAYISVLVGLALIAAGVFLMVYQPQLTDVGRLCTCVGFGIVLVAFGTQVSGKWQTWTMAGSGAMAVALFLLLTYSPNPGTKNFAAGSIAQTAKYKDLTITGSRPLLVGASPSQDYRFAAFPDDLNSQEVYLYVTDESDPDMKEFYVGCIPVTLFREQLARPGSMALSLEWVEQRAQLLDVTTNTYYGEWNRRRCPRHADVHDSFMDEMVKIFGVGSAQAQTLIDIDAAMVGLESDDPDVRDAAREQLSMASPDQFSLTVGNWDIAQSSYRADLGRLVGWSDAVQLSSEPNAALKGDVLVQSFSDEQLQYLVGLVGHPDSTMRYWATDLTTQLLQKTEPQIQEKVLGKLFEYMQAGTGASSPVPSKEIQIGNLFYNSLVAVDGAKCSLSPSGQALVANEIEQFRTLYLEQVANTDKTAALAGQIELGLGNCQTPTMSASQ